MADYRIDALLERFDRRVEGEGSVTGALSSFLGESLLVDALVHCLGGEERVMVLPGTPTLDAAAMQGQDPPGFRDLDAWLLLDRSVLAAVKCKFRTASSLYGRTVAADPAEQAREAWADLRRDDLDVDKWTETNKVALPLRPPAGVEADNLDRPRRFLAFWWPISSDGRSWLSTGKTTTPVGGALQQVEVEVFSASLYLRHLRALGDTHLPPASGGTAARIQALEALF